MPAMTDQTTEVPAMLTCTAPDCDRGTFHNDPPLCLEHFIAADPNAHVEVSLAAFVAAEDAAAEDAATGDDATGSDAAAKPRRSRATTAG